MPKTKKIEENREELLDSLGRLVDTCENLMQSLTMQLPAHIHIQALRETMPEIRDTVKQAYFDLGGEDVWYD